MKYAIVDTRRAGTHGIKSEYHRLSSDKSRMIVNENELRYRGDPETLAEELGGELITREELNSIMNNDLWPVK